MASLAALAAIVSLLCKLVLPDVFCVSDTTSAVLDVVEEVASVAELVSSSDPLETAELSVTELSELDGADSPLDTLESVVLANVDSSLDGVEDTELSAAELEANES